MGNFITGIISLTLGVVMLANVLIYSLKNTNTSGRPVIEGTANINCTPGYLSNCSYTSAWTSGEIAMWGLVSLVAIAGMIYGVLNVFGIA